MFTALQTILVDAGAPQIIESIMILTELIYRILNMNLNIGNKNIESIFIILLFDINSLIIIVGNKTGTSLAIHKLHVDITAFADISGLYIRRIKTIIKKIVICNHI
ncbi:MAG: hypothetical protein ACI35S_04415 [Anaeroplasma sp.]